MSDYQPTPILTRHARERCAEMGISTKVVKRIYRNQSVSRPGNSGTGCTFIYSDLYPEYAIVVNHDDDGLNAVVVSVVFRTTERYIRRGETYDLA